MKVTSIVENTSNGTLPVEHGLSLYITKDDGEKVLFDMGQSALFARNAEALGLSIEDVDVAVISHGHYDHGGGLRTFLEMNRRAKVYIHRQAFEPHYSLRETGLRYIGLDQQLKDEPRLVTCEDLVHLTPEMTLFAGVEGDICNPAGNRLLFGPSTTVNDSFSHEQSLVIEEGSKTILFAGCAHRGIANIMRRAIAVTGKTPTHVLAGMHLVKSGLTEAEEDALIQTLAKELASYRGTQFYTMHCTGEAQYQKLKALLGTQIMYMACGDSMTI